MEILIIGVIFVALMAYISTRIKKAAKEAYEEEIIETEYFTIKKPEGFIVPVKDKSEFVFETYSKDFAEDEAEKFNQCWATVKEKDGIEYDSKTLETEKIEENITIKVFVKTLINNNLDKSFELEIFVLPDYYEQYSDRIKSLSDSFMLK